MAPSKNMYLPLRIMCLVASQQVAAVQEATVAEKAAALKTNGNTWRDVAEAISQEASTRWPKALGKSSDFNVSLDVVPLTKRFERLFHWKKGSRDKIAERLRRVAVGIIKQSQVHAPPDGMKLWDYFIPKQSQIVNAGKLASLQQSVVHSRRKSRQKTSVGKKATKPMEPSPRRSGSSSCPARSAAARAAVAKAGQYHSA